MNVYTGLRAHSSARPQKPLLGDMRDRLRFAPVNSGLLGSSGQEHLFPALIPALGSVRGGQGLVGREATQGSIPARLAQRKGVSGWGTPEHRESGGLGGGPAVQGE